MYEIDHVLVIGITTCMSMSMTTGRSHRSCLNLLYEMQRHVLTTFTSLLTVSYSSSGSSSTDNNSNSITSLLANVQNGKIHQNQFHGILFHT